MWDVDVKLAVGRMTRSGAMFCRSHMTSYQPRDWAVQGSNLVSGHAAPAEKVQILACWYPYHHSHNHPFHRLIVLSIMVL